MAQVPNVAIDTSRTRPLLCTPQPRVNIRSAQRELIAQIMEGYIRGRTSYARRPKQHDMVSNYHDSDSCFFFFFFFFFFPFALR